MEKLNFIDKTKSTDARGRAFKRLAFSSLLLSSIVSVVASQANVAAIITSITPDSGPIAGSTEITISGTDLIPNETDYIQSGLQLHLDARNNTGTGTHDNSATTWKNLVSGGADCTVVGGTWSDNSIKLDGTPQDYVRCGLYKFDYPTFEVVAKTLSLRGGFEQHIISNIENSGMVILINPSNNLQFSAWISGGWKRVYPTLASTNILVKYLTMSSRYDGAEQAFSINGEWWRNTQTGSLAYQATTPVVLGGNPTISGNVQLDQGYNGQICSARIYNRALTDAEVLHNQVVDFYRCGAGENPMTVTLNNADGPATCNVTEIASDGSYIKCTTTAHMAGVVDVTVDNGINSVTLNDTFNYVDSSQLNPTNPNIPSAPNTGAKRRFI